MVTELKVSYKTGSKQNEEAFKQYIEQLYQILLSRPYAKCVRCGATDKVTVVMPDHVHVILRTYKPENPSDILFFLKGRSAFELFKKHPNLRLLYRKGSFWSRGSFIRNIGVDVETERKYVRSQGDIHQTTLHKWAA